MPEVLFSRIDFQNLSVGIGFVVGGYNIITVTGLAN